MVNDDPESIRAPAQEEWQPKKKTPSSGNLVKIIVGALILGAVAIIAIASFGGFLSPSSGEPSEGKVADQVLVGETPKESGPTIVVAPDVVAPSAIESFHTKMQTIRMYAGHFRDLVMTHKWIALTISILVVIIIAGAITGGVLYHQHQQQEIMGSAGNGTHQTDNKASTGDDVSKGESTVSLPFPIPTQFAVVIAIGVLSGGVFIFAIATCCLSKDIKNLTTQVISKIPQE